MPRRRFQRDTSDPRRRLAKEEGLEAIETRLYHRYMWLLFPPMYLTYHFQAGMINIAFLLLAHFAHWIGHEEVRRWGRPVKLEILNLLIAFYIISQALMQLRGFESLQASAFSSFTMLFGFGMCIWSIFKINGATKGREDEYSYDNLMDAVFFNIPDSTIISPLDDKDEVL